MSAAQPAVEASLNVPARRVWETSLFAVLPDDVVDEVAGAAVRVEVPAGTVLRQPELALVEHGLVRAFVPQPRSRQLTTGYARRSELVGLAAKAGLGYPLSWRAVTDCDVLRLAAGLPARLAEEYPLFGWSAARAVAEQLDALLAEVRRVSFGGLRQRLAYHLLNLTSVDGQEQAGPVAQAEVDAAVGDSNQLTHTAVIQCQAKGLIAITSGGLVVLDRPALRLLAEE